MLVKNIVFNYIGRLYSTLIGILILPMYLMYMGAESYGLVGFFTLIQAWMQLFDAGMNPTLAREVAKLKNVKIKQLQLVTVVNTVEICFLFVALCLGIGVFVSKEWIATGWLNVEEISFETVTNVLSAIAIIISLRWMSTINRSGINAYEEQVWLNVADIIINTLRFPGSLVLMMYTSGDIIAYFYFQIVVAIFELAILRFKFRKLLPDISGKYDLFSFLELKRIAPFALSVAYTTSIWVFLTQLDKLLLSNILSLADYGYFTLVATISMGLISLSSPVSKAILPRMTALLAQGKEDAMIKIYRLSTRLVVSITAPLAIVISMYPELVIYVWTGDLVAAKWGSDILPMFVLGSGLLTIIAFQYYLQYAFGRLSYHVYFNTFSIIINVPLIVYAATYYQALGVAWVWLGYRVFSFLIWVPIVHKKFVSGLHYSWLLKDVFPSMLLSVCIAYLSIEYMSFELGAERFIIFWALSSVVLVSVSLCLSVSFSKIIFNRFLHGSKLAG